MMHVYVLTVLYNVVVGIFVSCFRLVPSNWLFLSAILICWKEKSDAYMSTTFGIHICFMFRISTIRIGCFHLPFGDAGKTNVMHLCPLLLICFMFRFSTIRIGCRDLLTL